MGSCLSCGSSAVDNYFIIEKIKLVKCMNCGLVYQKNPAYVEFSQASEYYNTQNLKHRIAIQSVLLARAKDRLLRLGNYLQRGNLLEIGGGTGEFCYLAEKQGWLVKMLELSTPFIKYAECIYGINTFNEILKPNTFNNNTFNCVAMFHVLEHISDPISFLQIINNILTEDGILIIAVPNLTSRTNSLFGKNNPDINKEDHILHFTTHSLEQLLLRGNFKVIEISSWEPATHWATTLYGVLGSIVHKKQKKNNLNTNDTFDLSCDDINKLFKNKPRFNKAMIPYIIGNLCKPLTWGYRQIIQKKNLGQEVWCVARKI